MIINIIFLITFMLIWNIYTHSKYIGLFLAIFTFFIVILMPFVNNYKSAGFMIKMNLIIFSSLCIMIGLIYKCTRHSINQILTWSIRLNIGILLFVAENYIIKALLLFSAITTPYIYINDTIVLKPSFINKDLWVFLTGIILLWFYITNKDFNTNNTLYIVLLAIIIPTLFHFINNKYFESRAILMCLVLIFDVFNHNKNIIKILTNY